MRMTLAIGFWIFGIAFGGMASPGWASSEGSDVRGVREELDFETLGIDSDDFVEAMTVNAGFLYYAVLRPNPRNLNVVTTLRKVDLRTRTQVGSDFFISGCVGKLVPLIRDQVLVIGLDEKTYTIVNEQTFLDSDSTVAHGFGFVRSVAHDRHVLIEHDDSVRAFDAQTGDFTDQKFQYAGYPLNLFTQNRRFLLQMRISSNHLRSTGIFVWDLEQGRLRKVDSLKVDSSAKEVVYLSTLPPHFSLDETKFYMRVNVITQVYGQISESYAAVMKIDLRTGEVSQADDILDDQMETLRIMREHYGQDGVRTSFHYKGQNYPIPETFLVENQPQLVVDRQWVIFDVQDRRNSERRQALYSLGRRELIVRDGLFLSEDESVLNSYEREKRKFYREAFVP